MLGLTAILIATAVVTLAAHDPKPSDTNVVVILADDLGYGDLGRYGGKIPTPNLDRLATEGVRATDFTVAQPVCSASRAAFLTGRHPHRIGITGALGPDSPRGIAAAVTTLAETARDAGRATAIFGKWHLGSRDEFLPTRHGFDLWYGIPYSNDMHPRHPETPKAYPPLPLVEADGVAARTVALEPDQSRFTLDFTRRACDFIRTRGERPFFLWLAHPMPHVPLAVSEEGRGKTGLGLYADVIHEIDASVGVLLRTLDETGDAGRTLVVFTSDNGPWLSYGDHAGSAGPLREGKGTTFEGGIRVPFIARWPGRIPAGSVVREPFTAIDLVPTVREAIGATVDQPPVDGRSVLSAIEAKARLATPPIFHWYDGPGGSQQLQTVREGRWKLHLPHGYRSMKGREPGRGGAPGKYDYGVRIDLSLFDLETDPGETTDVAAAHPEVVERLRSLVEAEITKDAKQGG
jgi:arylsulfatase A-like enzyme